MWRRVGLVGLLNALATATVIDFYRRAASSPSIRTPRSDGVDARRSSGVYSRLWWRWVLTLPHRMRYVLAWEPALCRAVAGVFMRAVLGFLWRRARDEHGVVDGRSGAVLIIQRFGSALNLNPHTHALVLDGVFAEDGSGGLRFHPAAPPTGDAMDQVLATIERRIRRLLARAARRAHSAIVLFTDGQPVLTFPGGTSERKPA